MSSTCETSSPRVECWVSSLNILRYYYTFQKQFVLQDSSTKFTNQIDSRLRVVLVDREVQHAGVDLQRVRTSLHTCRLPGLKFFRTGQINFCKDGLLNFARSWVCSANENWKPIEDNTILCFEGRICNTWQVYTSFISCSSCTLLLTIVLSVTKARLNGWHIAVCATNASTKLLDLKWFGFTVQTAPHQWSANDLI